jgi:hypothetical protein
MIVFTLVLMCSGAEMPAFTSPNRDDVEIHARMMRDTDVGNDCTTRIKEELE